MIPRRFSTRDLALDSLLREIRRCEAALAPTPLLLLSGVTPITDGEAREAIATRRAKAVSAVCRRLVVLDREAAEDTRAHRGPITNQAGRHIPRSR